MQDYIIAKASCVVAIGKAVIPPLGVWMLSDAFTIDEGTRVPLTIVVAVGGACWYLNGRFTKIEDKIKSLTEALANRPCGKNGCPTPETED